MRLLGCSNPDEVVRVSLELLRDRVRASVVGFLWSSDDGQLKPKLVIPEDAFGKVQLSNELTNLVTREGKAIWIDNQQLEEKTRAAVHYADAICVPLFHEGRTLGAMHVYLEKGRFRQTDFDMAIPLANIMTVAPVRSRREYVLQVEQQRLADKSGISMSFWAAAGRS